MKSKRGFTALFITIVSFSLLMAIGVTVVTKLLFYQVEGETSCEGVRIDFDKLDGNLNVCKVESLTNIDLNFKVKNSGGVLINGLDIKLEGVKGNDDKIIRNFIKPGDINPIEINFDKLKYGDIEEVSLIPFYGRHNTDCVENIISTNITALFTPAI